MHAKARSGHYKKAVTVSLSIFTGTLRDTPHPYVRAVALILRARLNPASDLAENTS